MSESEELAYLQGEKAAWRRVLGHAIHGLMSEGDADRWRLERADVVAMLRIVCEDFGDNEWEDNLHLADVIDKHLARHLHSDEE